MAIIVEDGTGLPAAETYASVVDFTAHCGRWGYDLTGKTEPQQEAALRQAAAFIDTMGIYKGARLSAVQAMEFPRDGLTDDAGLAIVGVPARVIRACCDLAFKALGSPLLADLDRGGRIVSESVGPISTTYAADAPAGRVYQLAEKLLAPFLRPSDGLSRMNGPSYADTDPGLFSIGMHDNGG